MEFARSIGRKVQYHEVGSSGKVASPTDDPSVGSPSEEMEVEDVFVKRRRNWWPWIFGLVLIIGAGVLTGLLSGLIPRHKKHRAHVPHLTQYYSNFTDADFLNTTGLTYKLNTNVNYTVPLDWDYDAAPQHRHYTFNITNVNASTDGIIKKMLLINGQFPGPMIVANENDTIVLDVINNSDQPVTIHMHGLLFNFPGGATYDGSSSLNQCEIQPGYSFQYSVPVTGQYGTYWYHSHFSVNDADGLVGPIVIQSLRERELVGHTYDYDKVIMISDVYHRDAATYMDKYMGSNNENQEPSPDNTWIQGSSYFEPPEESYDKDDEDDYYSSDGIATLSEYDAGASGNHFMTLLPHVRYRLRIINAGLFAPLEFTLDQHDLDIVEVDGFLTQPYTVDNIPLQVAQRVSVIVHTNQTSDNNLFYIRARYNTLCFTAEVPGDNVAVVAYGEDTELRLTNTLQANTSAASLTNSPYCDDLPVEQMKPLVQSKYAATQHTSVTVVPITVSFMIGAYQMDKGYLNDTYFLPLDRAQLYYKLNHTQDMAKEKNFGHQLIYDVPEAGYLDILVNNLDDGPHPFHLHGAPFAVIARGLGAFRPAVYDTVDWENLVERDTLQIRPYGWSIVRVLFDNPGLWPFHCHMGWHMDAGLVMTFNVMESEYTAESWMAGVNPQWMEQCAAIPVQQ